MRRAIAVLCVLAALGAGGLALASQKSSVSVTEKEFKITPSVSKAKAGSVTFTVKNIGHLSHEFLVLETSTPASKLKTKGAVAVVTGLQGKIASFKPGKTKTLTLTLKPGHYVLICNIPGHYQAGQRADFTVG